MTQGDRNHSATAEVAPEPVEAGLRERKKAQTREALAREAIRRFAEQGFDNTTIDEIAEACGVSRRTFFRYFSSKEDVLVEPHDKGDMAFELIAARPADEPPLASLRAVVLAMAENLEDQKELILLRARIVEATPSLRTSDYEFQREAAERIADALARRSPQPPSPDERYQYRLVAQATLAALLTAMEHWAEQGGEGDLVARATEALDLLAAGFRD